MAIDPQLGEQYYEACRQVGFDNGIAALAAFRADPQRFDLMITDEIMPGMTGTELAGAAHEVLPLGQIAPRLIEWLRANAGAVTSRV